MIKLIKLCFVCCLIFRATFVEAVIAQKEAYKVLKDLDAEVWRNKIIPYYQDQLGNNQDIAQNTFEYFGAFYKYGVPQLFGEPPHVDFSWIPVLDFSQASMLDIISAFYEILEQKVACRDEEYVINDEGRI